MKKVYYYYSYILHHWADVAQHNEAYLFSQRDSNVEKKENANVKKVK